MSVRDLPSMTSTITIITTRRGKNNNTAKTKNTTTTTVNEIRHTHTHTHTHTEREREREVHACEMGHRFTHAFCKAIVVIESTMQLFFIDGTCTRCSQKVRTLLHTSEGAMLGCFDMKCCSSTWMNQTQTRRQTKRERERERERESDTENANDENNITISSSAL